MIKSNQGVFCYVNEATLGKHLQWELSGGENIVIRRLELSVLPDHFLHLPEGRVQSQTTDGPINFVSVPKPTYKSTRNFKKASGLVNVSISEEWCPRRGHGSSEPFPTVCLMHHVHLAVPKSYPFIISQ